MLERLVGVEWGLRQSADLWLHRFRGIELRWRRHGRRRIMRLHSRV